MINSKYSCCPVEFIEAIRVLNKQAYLYFLCGELDFSKGLFIFM